MIKFQHTVFAMPIALLGALATSLGLPPMAFNRIADRDLDGATPRTRDRALPVGQVSLGSALALLGLVIVLFGFSAGPLGPLPWKLTPRRLLIILGYSFCKRFPLGNTPKCTTDSFREPDLGKDSPGEGAPPGKPHQGKVLDHGSGGGNCSVENRTTLISLQVAFHQLPLPIDECITHPVHSPRRASHLHFSRNVQFTACQGRCSSGLFR